MFNWIFIDNNSLEYVSINEQDLTCTMRHQLEKDGFELYADSVKNVGVYMSIMLPNAKHVKYEVTPITLKEAQIFIDEHHRHHNPPQGHKFSIGLRAAGKLIGAVVAGRPISRYLDDGTTLEVTRCCVLQGFKNAVTKLYGAVNRVAKAMGYKRIITYTLITENGSSMRAAGYTCEGVAGGGSWNCNVRKRVDTHPTISKYRWSKAI